MLDHAARKVYQLRLASELGFELPPTLITNDPDEVLSFYEEQGGRLISKLPGSAMFRLDEGTQIYRYTQPVTRRDLTYVDTLRVSPSIFQGYVDKRIELRITVVGDRIFAAEIHSQASLRTRVDWRRYDGMRTPHRVHALPAHVADRCRILLRRLRINFGAIDMILTPDDRYVFLEVNPNGQYLWIEKLTGLPITDAVADLLTRAELPPRAVS